LSGVFSQGDEMFLRPAKLNLMLSLEKRRQKKENSNKEKQSKTEMSERVLSRSPLFLINNKMQDHEFISEVQQRIRVESAEDAKNTVRATLQTLADHLAGNAPAKLAAQLPEEIGAFITEHKSDPNAAGEGFGVEEFVRRTAERSGLQDAATAESRAVAVLAVMREAISEGEFAKMRGTLPDEYDALFADGYSANL
jgi:uncharacterized protein (DUF2267 family)